MKRWLMAALLLALIIPAHALIETYEFDNEALEERYYRLSFELRCPKCQNQNIADSDAPIAQDLRRALHAQLQDGATDEEILEQMVARYGEFVRYRPAFAGANVLLWLAPVVFLVCGGLIAFSLLRRRPGAVDTRDASQGDDTALSASVPSPILTAEEQARVADLLESPEHKS